ncbi:MAG: hypothetical protein ACRDK5_03085 [Solirubrobacterales bacterium]
MRGGRPRCRRRISAADLATTDGATQGAIDTRFTYGALVANGAGNASAKGKSATFNWGTDE